MQSFRFDIGFEVLFATRHHADFLAATGVSGTGVSGSLPENQAFRLSTTS